MPVVTRRMGKAMLGEVLTHDVMGIIMDHLTLRDALRLSETAQEHNARTIGSLYKRWRMKQIQHELERRRIAKEAFATHISGWGSDPTRRVVESQIMENEVTTACTQADVAETAVYHLQAPLPDEFVHNIDQELVNAFCVDWSVIGVVVG